MDDFVKELRGGSRYPLYRGLVNFLVVLSYCAAALIVGASLLAARDTPIAIAVGPFVAICVVVLARLIREMLLMVADIADATVSMAARGSEKPNQDWASPTLEDLTGRRREG